MGLVAALLLLGSAAPADTPNWHYRPLHDDMTDMDGGIAMVMSVDGKAGFGMTCDVSKPERFIFFRVVPPKDRLLRLDKTTVAIRPGSEPPFSTSWWVVTNGAIALLPGQVQEIMDRVGRADQILVRADDIDGQSIDMRFHVTGAEKAFKWVLDECGWPNYPKAEKRR